MLKSSYFLIPLRSFGLALSSIEPVLPISILALPPDAKFHNLLSLAAKDLIITPDPKETGSSLLVQHQKLMLEHFGHKETAVLPEDVIQRFLLGVSTSLFIAHLQLIPQNPND